MLEEIRCPFFSIWAETQPCVGTYSKTEDGLSQLLELLFSLTDSHLRALLHVTDLPLRENTHTQKNSFQFYFRHTKVHSYKNIREDKTTNIYWFNLPFPGSVGASTVLFLDSSDKRRTIRQTEATWCNIWAMFMFCPFYLPDLTSHVTAGLTYLLRQKALSTI